MNLKICAAVIVTVGLVGCAKRPDAIVPVDIPMAAYTNLGCQSLAQEMIKEQANLASLSKQQNQAATGDAVGVFLLGVPASSTFGGDKEGQVAVSKGKVKRHRIRYQKQGLQIELISADGRSV